MKARKAFLLLLAALTLAACKYDDSALWEQVNQNTEELAAQAARIAALEAWQAETNTNIQALQTLLSTTDYITAVTPVVKDGVEVGYTISFLHTPAITIYHGTKGDKGDTGDTPQIGAAQAEDGNWYWTLNGEFLTDADGNPIRANGTQGEQGEPGSDGDDGISAPLPQLATGTKLTEQNVTTDTQNNPIEPDAIYLSVDGGQTWTRVSGEKGNTGDTGATGATGPKGDSFFKSIDYTSNDDYVTFTLADGTTKFSVPRYVEISLTFDVSDVWLVYGEKTMIQCTVTGIDSPTADDLYLIAVPDGWTAVIKDLTIIVTAPNTDSEGEILVMLDNKKGNTTIGRIPVKATQSIVDGTSLKAGGLTGGDLAAEIGSHTGLTSITVTSGEINDDDWAAVKSQGSLTDLDLAGATYTGTNAANIVYIEHLGGNSTLQTLKLPQGVTGIGDESFIAFTALKSVVLPDGLTSIESYAFLRCSALTSITLPASLTSIGYRAFRNCRSLNTVTCLATTPPGLGGDVFSGCDALTAIQVPAASVDDYKAASEWSNYADKIVAIEP